MLKTRLPVGGEILDLALRQAKEFSRFVMCGAISQYNATQPVGPRNITRIIQMRIKMQGFIVLDHRAQYPEARELSAGMSGDLEIAVQHGSTCVRVGTAIMGDRPLISP